MNIGIFGGTFDPIHNAHLFVAESARRLEGLDRVLFVPTNTVHYRSAPEASAADRCAMIALAIASNDAFALDQTDVRAGATGYTADLLPKIAAAYPGARLTFITGADSIASGAWSRFDEVLEALDAFVVAPRAGVSADAVERAAGSVPSALRARVKMLDLPDLPESATLVRTLLSQRKSVRYLVPEPTWRYIVARDLYGLRHGDA